MGLIEPEHEAIDVARRAWSWLVPEPWTCIACSAMGDIFLRNDLGEVLWLDCGQGSLERIAQGVDDFQSRLDGDEGEEWLLLPLVKALRRSGKILDRGQCYGFKILPIFAEGSYELDNIYATSAAEHSSVTGMLHRQIRDLPDGATVELKVTP
jgi:hypothetical protein